MYSKAWNRAIYAVFNIKSREITGQLLHYCDILLASIRINYLQLNLLHSLKN